MNPVPLLPHYLCLITEAVRARGGFCMCAPSDEMSGTIYVSRSSTSTAAEYAISYRFDAESVDLVVKFADARQPVCVKRTYWQGIGEFFPAFSKALDAPLVARVPGRDPITFARPDAVLSVLGVFREGLLVGDICQDYAGFIYKPLHEAPLRSVYRTLEDIKTALRSGALEVS